MTDDKKELPAKAYPGLSLGPAKQYAAGPGTHIYDGQIVASLLGRPAVLPILKTKSTPGLAQNKAIITVRRPELLSGLPEIHSPCISNRNILPCVGSVVLAQVLRVRFRQIDVGIVAVGRVAPLEEPVDASTSPLFTDGFQTCADEWPAVIRREDVRATEKDKVVCADGFRVGDLVRGQVISLGDQANYYLTTARNELGVLLARSELTGTMMQPISWKSFRDPDTGQTEERKVAKPV